MIAHVDHKTVKFLKSRTICIQINHLEDENMCECKHTPQCHGIMAIILGVLLIANQKWLRWDIWVFIGSLVILKGVIKMAMPSCGCQKNMPMETVSAKKGRK